MGRIAQIRASYVWRVFHPEQSARMRQSTRCRQIVKVDGIQERLYRIRVQVTINDGRWRAGVPIFGHPAPEMITDSPAVLNRIKRLESEAQLLLSRNPYARHPRRPPLRSRCPPQNPDRKSV